MSLWFRKKFFEKAHNVEYLDLIVYSIEEFQVGYRSGSVEVNENKSTVYAVRAFNKGKWVINSTYDLSKIDIILNRTVEKALHAEGTKREWYSVSTPVKGKYALGSKIGVEDREKALELSETLCDRIIDKGCSGCEVIITLSKTYRQYVSSENADAEEEANTTYILIYGVSEAARRGVAGEIVGYLGNLTSINESFFLKLADKVAERAKSCSKAKTIHPLRRGLKWDVVFDHVTSAAVFHEVAHMLEADTIRGKVNLPYKFSKARITLIDDPTIPWGFGSYVFDDEGVRARRKTLIEDGEIVNLIHTRETAAKWGVEPLGNARGIFHKPKALASNIVVKPSDWRFEELIEETREGIYVEGLVKAELSLNNIVTLIPEVAWIIEKGELKEPVLINYVKLQIPKHLNYIEGLGKELKQKPSFEKGYRMSEYAPPMKIKGVLVG